MARIPLTSGAKSLEDEKSKVESRKSLESREKVESRNQKKRDAHIKWAQDKAQISFRLDTTLKQQIDEHTKSTGESIVQFVIRAIQEQMKRDEKSQ